MVATPDDGKRDPGQPDGVEAAVAAAALRLMAGAVPKPALERLRTAAMATGADYPWEATTRAILAAPVEPQRLVQQGLIAQRDWILRGGRENPKPGIGRKAKGLLARLCAQFVFGALFAIVLVTGLVAARYKWPAVDIYVAVGWLDAAVTWCRQTFAG
ncbi:MAG: hypothetical protein FJ301_00920 [Planctomycetes bacterium]|nr:hypothetical protein [Planctomycetota bacterium]